MRVMKNTYELSADFIKSVHSAACDTWKQRIEKEVPELFKAKLEVARWYQNGDRGWGKHIAFVEELRDGIINDFKGYGFSISGDWVESREGHGSENWLEAPEEIVFESLKNEAIKRGLVEGVSFNYPHKPELGVRKVSHDYHYVNGQFGAGSYVLMDKQGRWAVPVPQREVTLSEATAILSEKYGEDVKIVGI